MDTVEDTITPAKGDVEPAPAMPLFYSALEVVSAQSHGLLRLRRDAPLPEARAIGALPLTVNEIPLVGRHLPVVFAEAPPHAPVALMRLTEGGAGAAFDEAGHWRAGRYIPVYLRRLPFLLVATGAGDGRFVLCCDPTSPAFSSSEGAALYDTAGDPTQTLQAAFAVARDAQAAFERTRLFCERLQEIGLLMPSTARVAQRPGMQRALEVTGFRAVDRAALARLEPAQLAQLRDDGYLEAIYAHLHSIEGIGELPLPV